MSSVWDLFDFWISLAQVNVSIICCMSPFHVCTTSFFCFDTLKEDQAASSTCTRLSILFSVITPKEKSRNVIVGRVKKLPKSTLFHLVFQKYFNKFLSFHNLYVETKALPYFSTWTKIMGNHSKLYFSLLQTSGKLPFYYCC